MGTLILRAPVSVVDPLVVRPDPGTFRNISNNTLEDVNPCPGDACVYSGTGVDSNFTVWGGGAFAPDFGDLGAIAVYSGGHLSWDGNVPFVFDIATGLWSCIGTPSANTETDADANGEFPDGRSFVPHTYNGILVLPVANGGGTKGKLIRFGFAGASVAQLTHSIDLATGEHARFADTSGVGGSYYSAAWDSSRNRFWILAGYNSFFEGHAYVEADGTVTTLDNLGDNIDGANHALGYEPNHDMLVHYSVTGGNQRLAGRLCSGSSAFATLTTSGTPPTNPNAGLEWCPTLGPRGCFVSYYGNGEDEVFKLTAPESSPLSNTWVWTSETLTGVGGATPIVADYPSGYNGQWSRFRYAPSLDSFIYADGATNPVQLWTLSGM